MANIYRETTIIRYTEIAAKQLIGLENTQLMRDFVQADPAEVSRWLCSGLTSLVESFNTFIPQPEVLDLMPATKELRQRLAGGTLPLPQTLTPHQIVRGIENATPLILRGQEASKNRISLAAVGDSIGTPSLKTRPAALVPGTGLHLYERSAMVVLEDQGIRGLKKDSIIKPVEEIAILRAALELKEDPNTKTWIQEFVQMITASPPIGLGWKKPEYFEQMRRRVSTLN